MTIITAELVKTLREKTGAGMMDCKKALGETNGDMEKAIDWLRKKGLSAAAKKSGRVAAEGLVGVLSQGTAGAMIEINSETDFVARNDKFQQHLHQVLSLALHHKGSFEDLLTLPHGHGYHGNVTEATQNLVAVIGENIHVRRMARLEVISGVVASYVHNATAPGLGRIGVLVALESSAPASTLEPLAKQIAMHIAATAPQSIDIDSLNPELVARERAIFSEQAEKSGKPVDVIAKMVEGRLKKFYEESVLLEQAFIMDNTRKVKDVLKDAGAPASITGFFRFSLGEGIEKKEDDFAAEVASLSK